MYCVSPYRRFLRCALSQSHSNSRVEDVSSGSTVVVSPLSSAIFASVSKPPSLGILRPRFGTHGLPFAGTGTGLHSHCSSAVQASGSTVSPRNAGDSIDRAQL